MKKKKNRIKNIVLVLLGTGCIGAVISIVDNNNSSLINPSNSESSSINTSEIISSSIDISSCASTSIIFEEYPDDGISWGPLK